MPDTSVLDPPSGNCDSPSSSLATLSPSPVYTTATTTTTILTTTSNILDPSPHPHSQQQPLKPLHPLEDVGITGCTSAIVRQEGLYGSIISSITSSRSSGGVAGTNGLQKTFPNPSTPTSPTTTTILSPLSIKPTPAVESFPSTPISPIDDEKEAIGFSSPSSSISFAPGTKNGGSGPLSHGAGTFPVTATKKEEGSRVATSYYSTLALRQIKDLSNAPPPDNNNQDQSSENNATVSGSKDSKDKESSSGNNNNSNHSNRASISLTSSNPLVSLANFARAVSGSTTSTSSPQTSSGTTPTSATVLPRKKTLSSRRQSDGALLKNNSFDNLERLNQNPDRFNQQSLTSLTLEEVLETTGNHSQAVALDPTANSLPNMHQSSSRLLRMTQDDRPFTRDFKDLFSTLMVSLPLNAHRLRFKTYPFTFTSDEAVNNLGSLKFSQSNRMPDPKDPSRIVTTTTTTTFSMAKDMARTVCQKFVSARFMEAVGEKSSTPFSSKNLLWQLTPKGIHVLERFCQRNGINSPHVMALLASQYNTMRLVILERDPITDKVSGDKQTTEIIFRRFAGSKPNIKSGGSGSDSDSLSEYADGTTGIRVMDSRKVYDKTVKNTFTGKAAVDWLLDCCTSIEPTETHEIAALFARFNLIQCVVEDKLYVQQFPKAKEFQPTKNAIYTLTERGQRAAGWIDGERGSIENGKPRENGFSNGRNGRRGKEGESRETNTTRLASILGDPALRLLFREFLRQNLCEENLSFWLEVQEFQLIFKNIDVKTLENIREALASAYGIYNAFLAPGSPCELNIDHTLRQDLASRMTRAVAKDEQSMYSSLKEVATLFERAQEQVFKLMAGDSVPKFLRDPRYIEIAGEHNSDDD